MTSSDRSAKIILIFAFIIALFLLLPENLIYINATILKALPWPVPLLFCILPIAMYWGFAVDQTEQEIEKNTLDQIEAEKGALKQEIFFLARYRTHLKSSGTEWEIRNLGHHSWEQAIFIIECMHAGKKNVEKHTLQHMRPNERRILTSQLSYIPTARWRVMVLTDTAYHIDLAEQWKETFWALKK